MGSKEFFEAARKYRYEVYAPWLKEIINQIDVRNKAVLEIGCGMGLDLLSLAQNHPRTLIGIDLVPKHLMLARKLFDCYGFSAEFFEMDAESLNFAPGSIDLVYSFGILHHTPNIEKAISNIYNVLKPGGQAVIGLYHKNSWQYWVNIIFVQGFLGGKLLKMTVEELLSRVVEFSETDARPLVRVYSEKDCRILFREFSQIKIKKYHWRNDQVIIVRRFPPAFLPSVFGWYIFSFVGK